MNNLARKITFAFCVLIIASTVTAQNSADSLTRDIRRYVARNFTKSRTFNLYWETNPTLNYSFKQQGKELENGKIRNMHAIKFAVTIPVLLVKNFSLYVNEQSNFYKFENPNYKSATGTSLFSDDEGSYNYHKVSMNGIYHTKIGNKPLILSSSIIGDGWSDGVEKLHGTLSVIMIFRRTATSYFGAGLYGMTLFNEVPVMPVITYWHQFSTDLSIDITLPSSTYLRYHFLNNHRLSVGTSMDTEQFYTKPGRNDLPKVCYFSKTSIKPEVVYEYLINKHFYLIARAGASKVITGGLYNTNRKGLNGDPLIEYSQPITPFFYLGFSYNIF